MVCMFQKFNCEPVIPVYSAKPEQVETALKHVYSAAMNKLKGKELELLIAILPDNNGSLYGMSAFHIFHHLSPLEIIHDNFGACSC